MGFASPTRAQRRDERVQQFRRFWRRIAMARELLIPRFILASDQQPDETVVRDVLNYFLRNPQAVDSLEGIARWRLLDEVVRRKVEETRKALEWLVRQKYLSKTMVAGGDPVFSLNPDNIAKAKEFLSAPDLLARKKKN
jgi:hypothetical protein